MTKKKNPFAGSLDQCLCHDLSLPSDLQPCHHWGQGINLLLPCVLTLPCVSVLEVSVSFLFFSFLFVCGAPSGRPYWTPATTRPLPMAPPNRREGDLGPPSLQVSTQDPKDRDTTPCPVVGAAALTHQPSSGLLAPMLSPGSLPLPHHGSLLGLAPSGSPSPSPVHSPPPGLLYTPHCSPAPGPSSFQHLS